MSSESGFGIPMGNFTPRAQQVLKLAAVEAANFGHDYIGTEHLLLGVIKLAQGVAVAVLKSMDLDLERVRVEVEKQSPPSGATIQDGEIQPTPRTKMVLQLDAQEARGLY